VVCPFSCASRSAALTSLHASPVPGVAEAPALSERRRGGLVGLNRDGTVAGKGDRDPEKVDDAR